MGRPVQSNKLPKLSLQLNVLSIPQPNLWISILAHDLRGAIRRLKTGVVQNTEPNSVCMGRPFLHFVNTADEPRFTCSCCG